MHDIFYFTDVHGQYDLFHAAMEFCKEQDPECMIVYGGDACDRGPYGYKIMKELLDTPNVVYLKGNHEDMFVHAAWLLKRSYTGPLQSLDIRNYLYSCYIEDFYSSEIRLCIHNGGMETLTDWMMDGMPMEFVDRINNLPLTISYETLDFCHAGGDPKIFAKVSTNEYHEEWVDADDQQMILWDRNWLGFGWMPGRTCVFGHTPTPYLPAKYYGQDKALIHAHPCKYVSQLDTRLTGARLAMDTGAIASNRLYVLNCLTMKAYGFKLKADMSNEENPAMQVEQFEIIQF